MRFPAELQYQVDAVEVYHVLFALEAFRKPSKGSDSDNGISDDRVETTDDDKGRTRKLESASVLPSATIF